METRHWERKREAKQLVLPFLLLAVLQGEMVKGASVAPKNGLSLHYYKFNTSCTHAEDFVKHLVTKAWNADPSVTPALLNILYSDCLISGCDASILLDGERTEKKAIQNRRLREMGFKVIDEIKRVMEARCPGVVSCSDILNLAAKEAVALAGAPKYPVYTGRRDGLRSTVESVDLPFPNVTWQEALSYFQSKGLDVLDLGSLLGAHSMGVAHCSSIRDRLYNFNGTGRADGSMGPKVRAQLMRQCPRRAHRDGTVFLDPNSGTRYRFENSYYKRALTHMAVLTVDQQMVTASSDGLRIAQEFAAGFEDMRRFFALGMARMGGLKVLTGEEGEIRRNCRFTNSH